MTNEKTLSIRAYLRSFNWSANGMDEALEIEAGDFVRTSDYLLMRREAEAEIERLRNDIQELTCGDPRLVSNEARPDGRQATALALGIPSSANDQSHLAQAIERLRSPNASFGGEYAHAHVLSAAQAAALLLTVEPTAPQRRKTRYCDYDLCPQTFDPTHSNADHGDVL